MDRNALRRAKYATRTTEERQKNRERQSFLYRERKRRKLLEKSTDVSQRENTPYDTNVCCSSEDMQGRNPSDLCANLVTSSPRSLEPDVLRRNGSPLCYLAEIEESIEPSSCIFTTSEPSRVYGSNISANVSSSHSVSCSSSFIAPIPVEYTMVLPATSNCRFCHAKKFHLETPAFCCSKGQVSLVGTSMPYALTRLLSGTDDHSVHFRTCIRTYNNNFAYTSLGAKYDRDLTKNRNGIYTFRVQGQVYHFLNDYVPSNDKPSGLQFYFYDSSEEACKRLNSSDKFQKGVLSILSDVLSDNPYSRFFADLRSVPSVGDCTIFLNSNPALDQRRYNIPSVAEVAGIFYESDDPSLDRSSHIRVYTHSGTSQMIKHYYGCYDPLQYPILFPRGECGWHNGIGRSNPIHAGNETFMPDVRDVNTTDELMDFEEQAVHRSNHSRGTVSVREYYCYKLQIRDDDKSMLIHTLRLFQQFIVDAYIKVETCRLDFHRRKQNEIRSESLQGVLDSVSGGGAIGGDIGRRIVLPVSFIGGPRDMRRRYLDAMALVQNFGKPDIFLTMTCNPNWKEITDNLEFHERPSDRPDLLSRVFKSRFEVLKKYILKNKIFGDVSVMVHVIEFQKRGMPHAHVLLILREGSKPLSPDAYDRIISAEIPDPLATPHLHRLVLRHMMHGPCGRMNPLNPCMRNEECKSKFPKSFVDRTSHADDTYPHYRRRNNGRVVRVRNCDLDNRWVVPYNPYLLSVFDCHMNVEICSTVKLVKYMYKYIYKGHDVVSFRIASNEYTQRVDEIKDFQDARWIGPSEAAWRIFSFPLSSMKPSVYTLHVHLHSEQMVCFSNDSDLARLMNVVDFSKTMLTEFFSNNSSNSKAKELNLLYREYPRFFVWNAKQKDWTVRKRHETIGRLVTVNPNEGERYYLRLLLSHVRCPTSYDDLLTYNAVRRTSFRQCALDRGLLASDTYIEDTLQEATLSQMPCALRSLFAILLVYCSPNDPTSLWRQFLPHLSSDYSFTDPCTSFDHIQRLVLDDVHNNLLQMGKGLADYNLLPLNDTSYMPIRHSREVEHEQNIVVSEEDLNLWSKLNVDQRMAYDIIMSSITNHQSRAFFLDGAGGAGKTFLYRAILATLRSQGCIAIAVATSGVAASILPGGRTAHSRFKIPIDITSSSTCNLSKQSSTAKVIISCSLILWDEATMARKETIEAFDALLRDLMTSDVQFGGKVVVFGGDFRQTLPVITKGTKDTQIKCSIVNSVLWPYMCKLFLKENMRARSDPKFCDFLLGIGEGYEPVDADGKVRLPDSIVLPFTGKESSLQRLISIVFPDLSLYASAPREMVNRCILSPKNAAVDDINDMVINLFPGESIEYTSTDIAIDQRYQHDYVDFFNSLNPSGLPPHKLLLKKNCPIMLLRNLNPLEGLCNGTRLICRELRKNSIYVEIASGHHEGKYFFLPKIPLNSQENGKHGISFSRTQFPVKLSFAMTINKAQGQTLDYVGVYLREPVFSHGQLYVALSRARTSSNLKVLIIPPTFSESDVGCMTNNIVFDEIFRLATL